MPGSGKHNVNNIDSFFKVRPSRTTIREGETISFLENGNLVKQEKRNGVVYETVYVEQGTKKQEETSVSSTSTSSAAGDITSVTAGTGLTGGGVSGPVTLNIDSTVTTLTGSQTLTNKTLTAPTFTGTAQGANLTLTGDLTVGGTTTTLNAQNLQVKDKNIVLNYLDGDASSTADGAGITIQDAVNSSTDATILWDNSSPTNSPGEFDFSHSINVTGNISVSGTVDGRDLATDGSKLDGIESNATADQTASEILTAIKTVDGATSGLDSDLLDGQHGSYYLDFGNFVIDDDEIPIAKLASDSVSYGGVSVTLGSSDATPAFDLSDATSLPIVAGTSGTLSVARGGTGATTLTSNAILTGNGTSAIQAESYLTFNGTSFEVENSSNGRGVQLNTNSEIKSLDGASWLHLQRYVDGNVAVGSNSNANLYVANKLGIGTSSPSYLLHLSGTAPELAFTDTDGSATWRTRAVTNNFHITETGAGDPFVIESGAGANAFKILNGGNVTIAQGKKFLFDGNGDTYIQSDTADNLRLVVGNRNMIEMIEDDSQDMVVIGNGSTDIDFIVEDDAGAAVLTVDSATSKTTLHSLDVTNNVGLGDVTADNVASNSFHYNNSGSLGAEAFTIGASGGVNFTQAIALSNADFSANSSDGAVLSLKTTLTNEDAVDVLGRINFSAPVSGNAGDDSRLLAASIVAQKSATFSSTSNQTDMIFQLGVSEVATEKFRILSDGKIKIGNAYTLPAADGSANQILKTNGSGTVSFAAESTPAVTSYTNTGDDRVLTSGGGTTINGEANLTFNGDFKVTGTLSSLETVNFDQASGDTAVLISGTGNQRLEFRDTATGANAWIGIPSWNDDALAIYGPTSNGNEAAYTYESSIHRFYTGSSEQMLINSNGSIALSGYTGQDRRIEIGSSRQANGYSYIDLIGDTTYSDFGARFIRENGGPNTGTSIEHRGTGVLSLNAKDAGSVRFYTSNSERVRIDSSGNMSLGNVSAQGAKLRLYGVNAGNWNDGLIIDDPSGWAATVYKRDNSPKMFTGLYSGNDNFIWMSSNYSNSGTTITAPRADAVLMARPGTDDLQIYLETHFGNKVGIGTTSPNHLLEIEGQTNDTEVVQISNNAGGSGSVAGITHLGITHFPGNTYSSTRITAIENGTASYTGHLAFSTRSANTDSAPAERMRIASSGNVGIGTISPTARLHISENGGSTDDAFVVNPDNGGNRTMTINGEKINVTYSNSGGAGPALVLQDNGGNVGIGTNSPQEELDIIGSLKVRGDSAAATEVLELGQFVSPNITTPQYTFNTYDSAGGLPSMGDHLEIRSVRWGQSISFSRNGQGGAVPSALFYNGGNQGYMELYRATNPTTDATYTTQVKLNVNGNSYLNGGNVGIGTTSPQRKLHVSTGNTDIAARFENTTSNGTVMELLASGDSTTMYFQTDHIYSSSNLHLGAGTLSNVYRANSHIFQVGSGNTTNITLNSNQLLFAQPTRIQFANDQRIFDDGGGGLKVGAEAHKLQLYAGTSTQEISFLTGGRNGTERAKITNTELNVDGNLTLQSGHYFTAHNESSYQKYDMYAGNGSYCIGMYSGNSFGGLNDWAMTFTFYDTQGDRGFLWRSTGHSPSQGAMSLTTGGKLSVAHSTRIGYGISDTTTSGATYALDVSGSIGATADVVAYVSSDKRLKDNIKNIANPLEKLEKLNGVEFDWNDKQDLYKGHDIGVIAQEVEEVLPEIVDTREDGHKAVKYDRMVALLIEAVKEQQQQINELKEKLNG